MKKLLLTLTMLTIAGNALGMRRPPATPRKKRKRLRFNPTIEYSSPSKKDNGQESRDLLKKALNALTRKKTVMYAYPEGPTIGVGPTLNVVIKGRTNLGDVTDVTLYFNKDLTLKKIALKIKNLRGELIFETVEKPFPASELKKHKDLVKIVEKIAIMEPYLGEYTKEMKESLMKEIINAKKPPLQKKQVKEDLKDRVGFLGTSEDEAIEKREIKMPTKEKIKYLKIFE